ncbi:phosphate acyltransferase PlsX [Metamycoplasma neophronis]|uniref:Phosphate acyltransferase n=1 Tax=Metamycoplasma neophronis TaxID=872983 RepID=A0ABY2Z0Q8_9BACT|nr:phosphate acyltransferase PlsX [Metamycoplasma neophronis]TPR54740.1 phosphate acyltransferase PlsX [Metamycoplasma neophronis]
MQRTIVFDVLNNDNGQVKAILGAKRFIEENPEYKLILVGQEEVIKNTLGKYAEKVEIISSNEIAHKVISPRDALRNQSSMLSAFNVLKEGKADAILSSGDSGSYITLASLKVKRLPNVSRPAFMPVLPTTTDKKMLLLDAGANLEIKAEYLNEWAKIASEFHKIIFKSNKPVVGQLNIGTEDYKGTEIAREANKLLKEQADNYSFKGFVEPSSAINGDVDILVADGYAGNIFLKTLESSFLGFAKLLKQIYMRNLKTKISALMIKKDLKGFKAKFDYRNTGGAYIVGLDKVVVKAHGGSDEVAFYNALNQIKIALDNNVIEKLKEVFEQAKEGEDE